MTYPAAGVATADNQTNGLQKVQLVDPSGSSITNNAPRTPVNSTALASSKVLATGAGVFYGANCDLDTAAGMTSGTYYLLAIDAASAVNGTVTVLRSIGFEHVQGTRDYVDFDEDRDTGIEFTDGCVIALSTTRATLTLGGAYLWVNGSIGT